MKWLPPQTKQLTDCLLRVVMLPVSGASAMTAVELRGFVVCQG